jgi:mercuric ion binding protein
MKRLLLVTLAASALGTMPLAVAAPKTVTLSVPDMTCPVCPLTVRQALNGVTGVAKVAVDFDRREATVVFDDATTTVDALRRATAEAGYPSTVKP